MIRTEAPPFGRLITAMVTPFDDQLKIDKPSVAKLVEHLIATGTQTIVVAGTTGESPTLDPAEKTDLLKLVIKESRGRAKTIMGTGSNDTMKSLEATKQAEALGADGVLLVAPYYNKPNQAGLLKHFETIANATRLPVVIYNIPGRTSINIAPETILELAARNPNIHALKDSTGDVEQSAEIAGKAREDFRIYSGDDYLTLPFLSVGACGIISVAGHFAGRQILKMMSDFFAGKLDEAREMHYYLLPLFKGLFAAPNPTCSKYALSRLGICKAHLRLPLVELDADQKTAVEQVLRQCAISAELSRA